LPTLIFKGAVYSGRGEGRKFIVLHWVKRQIEEKLGFTPYSGTLNIRLTKEGIAQKKWLEKAPCFEVFPEKGYCKGTLIRARVEGLACAVIVPEVPNYPTDVLEVVAAWCLRERLKLVDSSEVEVIVEF
jgi:riboflavin kinase, archaea type